VHWHDPEAFLFSFVTYLALFFWLGWQLDTFPQRYSNLSLIITGLAGYSAIVIPFGPSSLLCGVEVGQVVELKFEDNSTTANSS
jgi:hypothetical protein